MKKAVSLLLLAVLITSITMADVHQGNDKEWHEDRYGGKQKQPKYEDQCEQKPDQKQNGNKQYGKGKQWNYQYDNSGYDFVLKFERAARDGLWDQKSNRFKVVFNGKLVKDFLPKDYKIHKETLKLKGRNGKNTINFIGTGVSDSYGSQVDNIKLLKNGKDYIKNGGFEKGHKLGTDWTQWLIFKNDEFQGWNCKDEMQVGWGRIYNSNWPKNTRVCELDAIRNSDIFQTFYYGKQIKSKGGNKGRKYPAYSKND